MGWVVVVGATRQTGRSRAPKYGRGHKMPMGVQWRGLGRAETQILYTIAIGWVVIIEATRQTGRLRAPKYSKGS